MKTPFRISLAALVLVWAARLGAQATDAVRVTLIADEAEAASDILRARLAKEAVPAAAWERLFASEPYRRLKQRQADFGRAFADSSFRAFLMSDTLLARAPALLAAVEVRRRADVNAAARRALAYLPPGARIETKLYPMIKPATNSFVYGFGTDPAMFLYVDPAQSAAQFENQLAHELHHIGFATSCPAVDRTGLSETQRVVLERMGGFGEGLAMLAAAGGPRVHPHATSDSADRARWDRDVANVPADLERLQRYFLDALDGRLVTADSIRAVAMTFYGVQGPWYTVGWRMAATIEERLGRARLVAAICDPRRLLATYDEAARGDEPRWSDVLLAKLR
jgi:putative zinc-dependent peptidase DUF5700